MFLELKFVTFERADQSLKLAYENKNIIFIFIKHKSKNG